MFKAVRIFRVRSVELPCYLSTSSSFLSGEACLKDFLDIRAKDSYVLATVQLLVSLVSE